ncbi:unnamed protein product [Soboliphyme baturini]|uniref:peptidylprolyl isomerase n=1 Tax=Soboliphyme baturini TaxID=241478 RepID=A0A183J3H1_9BILA|nr:unnamed protein product [Soboliphyme baturini]
MADDSANKIDTVDCGLDITPDKDGGVIKMIIKPGVGEAHPATGNAVYVHYVGTLLDGSQFDSSRERNQQFSFVVGKGEVIKAWDLALPTMKKGEVCKITCQPKYAYGEAGSPPKIPANAVLVFEIELFHWEGEDISPDKDKTILRTLLVEGKKWDSPNDESQLNTHIVGFHEGRTFVDRDFDFILGECTEAGLPEGIDAALKKFNRNEKSYVQLKSKWCYGPEGNKEFGIPPNSELDFEIELKDFVKNKESWNMSEKEKIEESRRLKERGTSFFKAQKMKLALDKYKRIVDLLQHMRELKNDEEKEVANLLKAARLNMSLIFLKIGNTTGAIKECDEVLSTDAQNVKALYRRAQVFVLVSVLVLTCVI